jgi:hypothetical protein
VGTLALLLALDLVAQRLHGGDRRADELDLAAAAHLGEVVLLAQEPVARVDGLDVGDLGRGHDAVDAEVALVGRGVADADLLIRQVQVGGVGVGRGVHDGRLDAHLAAGPDDPQGDLAAVGYEDLGEHSAFYSSVFSHR